MAFHSASVADGVCGAAGDRCRLRIWLGFSNFFVLSPEGCMRAVDADVAGFPSFSLIACDPPGVKFSLAGRLLCRASVPLPPAAG